MSKGLKWILGILIALVVVAALAGIGYVIFNRWNGGWMMAPRAFEPREGLREIPRWNMPMRPNMRMFGYRSVGFFPLRSLGLLACLGLLGLIVIGGVVYLVGRRGRQAPAVISSPAATPIAAPEPTPAKACPNCGRAVNEDWSHCPYCGTALK